MHKIFSIFISLILFGIANSYALNPLTPDDLAKLDKELSNVESYDRIKFARIDSLKHLLNNSSQNTKNIELSIKIGNEYESFIADSALMYYEKGMTLAQNPRDSIAYLESRIRRMKVLGVSGFYKEADTDLTELKNMNIPDQLKSLWYDSCRQLYVYMIGYTEGNQKYTEEYLKRDNEFRTELLKWLDPESDFYKFNQAEAYQAAQEFKKAKRLFLELIDENEEGTSIYSRATTNLAMIEMQENHLEVAAHYLTLSAISDIRSSIKENMAIQQLAIYLYSVGNIESAYKYICVALEDANFCNARLRTMQISRNMPLIDSAYKSQIKEQRDKMLVILIIVSILSICLIGTIFLGLIQMRKLREARKNLKKANKIKEEYIGHFLDLCSIYMERLDNFCKVVVRKVTTGQQEELVKMTKSPKFAEEQHKQFYENFDSAFLHIYPGFVEQFNALLRPEERIEIKDGKLTTEMRIFAFLRMGVDDSNKIASFLHYSVNTIYTYRNKMRNKAINRETFENDVINIGDSD